MVLQVVSVATSGAGHLAGSFTVSYKGNTAEAVAGTGIRGFEAILESIAGVGAVTVTTDAVTTAVGVVKVAAVPGSPTVVPR